MKHLMMVLAVGVLLVAMVLATAVPAFAKGNPTGKTNPFASVSDDSVMTFKALPAYFSPDGFVPNGKDSEGGNTGYQANKTVDLGGP
jgi:hypothetical protein